MTTVGGVPGPLTGRKWKTFFEFYGRRPGVTDLDPAGNEKIRRQDITELYFVNRRISVQSGERNDYLRAVAGRLKDGRYFYIKGSAFFLHEAAKVALDPDLFLSLAVPAADRLLVKRGMEFPVWRRKNWTFSESSTTGTPEAIRSS